MQETLFADAARPATAVILRLRLLDYSIGHEILLQRQRNPLVTLSWEDFNKLKLTEQITALLRAVLVCSQTWEQNKKPQKWVWLWSWLNRKENYPLAIADFFNYRLSGSTFPVTTKLGESEAGRRFGGPLLARVIDKVAPLYGRETMDCPLGFSYWLYFSAMEAEGCVKIENQEERQTREEVDRALQEALEERKSAKEAK